jgi:hypothetical protein
VASQLDHYKARRPSGPAGWEVAWALRCLCPRPQSGSEQEAERTAGWRRQPLLRSLRLPRSTTGDRSPLLGNRLLPGSLSGSPSPVLSLLKRKRRDRGLFGSILSIVPARNLSICSIPGVLVSSVSSTVCCSRWWWCGAVDAVPWCCSLILWSLSTVAWCLGSLCAVFLFSGWCRGRLPRLRQRL